MAKHKFFLRWAGETGSIVHLRDARNNTFTLGGLLSGGDFSFMEITSNYFCIRDRQKTPIYRIAP